MFASAVLKHSLAFKGELMVLITLIKTKNNHVAFSSTTEATAKVYVLKTPAGREDAI